MLVLFISGRKKSALSVKSNLSELPVWEKAVRALGFAQVAMARLEVMPAAPNAVDTGCYKKQSMDSCAKNVLLKGIPNAQSAMQKYPQEKEKSVMIALGQKGWHTE
jgi:hypothetical protein